MSEWVAFVKKYSADNNLTYREALKQASKPYRESKGLPAKKDGPPKVKKPRKKKVKVEVDVAVDQQGEGVKEVIERIKDVVLLRDDPEGSPSVRANMKKYGDIKEADNFTYSDRTKPAIIFKPKKKKNNKL